MLQINNPNDKPVTINKYHLHITLIKQLSQKPRTPKAQIADTIGSRTTTDSFHRSPL